MNGVVARVERVDARGVDPDKADTLLNKKPRRLGREERGVAVVRRCLESSVPAGVEEDGPAGEGPCLGEGLRPDRFLLCG